MKKILFIVAVASSMLAAVSCSKDSTEDITTKGPIQGGPKITLEAVAEEQAAPEVTGVKAAAFDDEAIESPETRTTLSDGKIIWSTDDRIAVISKTDNSKYAEYILIDGAGTVKGRFEGSEVPGKGFAFYPYSVYKGTQSGTISFELPTTQEYAEGSFASGANPMIAQYNPITGKLDFKNLCGAIRLQLKGTATITKIVLNAPDGMIAGAATVSAAYTNTPAPKFSDAAAKTITLNVPNVTLDPSIAKSFYFVVPEGTYAPGMSFTITDIDNRVFTQTTRSEISVNRSKVQPFAAFKFVPAIAFPDEAFRNALATSYGLKKTADGTDISLSDPENKTKFASLEAVNVIGSSGGTHGTIKSITGIEYFTGLKTLYCYWQLLEILNLSQNTNLVTIDCGSNYITSLILPKTETLVTLKTADNKLTSLDVSQYPALTTLQCFWNNLSTLDISSCKITPGTDMFLVGQQTYDPTSKTSTQTLHLTMTDAQKAAWAAAPINSYNTNVSAGFFPDANFRAYLRDETTIALKLTSDGSDVDMQDADNRTKFTTITTIKYEKTVGTPDAEKISDLTGIEYIKNLTRLRFAYNLVSSVDLSKNTELLSLMCPHNKLSTLDISKNTKLQVFDISANHLRNIDLRNIDQATPYYQINRYGTQTTPTGEPLIIAIRTTAKTAPDLSQASNLHVCVALDNEKFIPDNAFRSYMVNTLKMVEKDGDIDFANDTNQTAFRNTLSINVSNSSISSIKGIECLYNLLTANLSNNQLTSIDISKNTELQLFQCSKNKLTALDVSKNINLRRLLCDENQITSLDLSQNTSVYDLMCNINQLTSLDVSKNTSLQKLICDTNKLTSLTLGTQPKLQNLICHTNQLTSLNMSGLGSELIQLSMCYNRLIACDISNLPNLSFTTNYSTFGAHTTDGTTARTMALTLTTAQKAAWEAAGASGDGRNSRITFIPQ